MAAKLIKIQEWNYIMIQFLIEWVRSWIEQASINK